MMTSSSWVDKIRPQFPILDNNPDVAYLDNAATSQKPAAVLDCIEDYSVTINANVARGSYPWAGHTAADIEKAGETVRELFAADGHVTWTSGATEGLHLLATDWYANRLQNGSEVIVPFQDHGALLHAWKACQTTLGRAGVDITLVPMPYEEGSGDYDYQKLAELVTERTAVVNATAVHHVYGNNMNLHRMRAAIGTSPALVVDAAQAAGHEVLHPKTIDADHVVFSGHKAYGPFGSGAIWSAAQREPAPQTSAWAGTPNVAGIIGLAAGLSWAMSHDLNAIHDWKTNVLIPLTDFLARSDSYSVLGCQDSLTVESQVQRRSGLCSFRHETMQAQDLAFVLASRDIYVRADSHCQAVAEGTPHPDPSVRVSVAPFTTPRDIERVVTVLKECE